MQFEMLKEKSSIIKVIGVGGGGGNAVNHMYRQGIKGVDFIVCNTDSQALDVSPVPNKVQLGASLTEGMGAGSIPEVGKNSAIENIEEIKQMLGDNTKMLFITAGLGGGTGTGASPIIAKAARDLGILTVGIVTTPFSFEGKRRKLQAEEGLTEFKKNVDSFLVISNDRLREIYGNLTLGSAFAQADNILTTAAKGIAEIITLPGYINVDFKDVRTVMKDSGVAIMGSFAAEGESRAVRAVQGALSSPLLKDNEIEGARYILLNITSGKKEVTMDEVSNITDYIQKEAGLAADLIWGNCHDETLGEQLSVTIIATGFQTMDERERLQTVKRPAVIPVFENKISMKPVNEFINVMKTEEELTQPYLKTEIPEEKKQADMFEALDQNTEPKIIRHSLIEEEPKAVEKQADELVFKIAKPEVKVEKPAAKAQPVEPVRQKPAVKPVSTEIATDESIEEQLRISRERIMRLKDLSMKLRNGNIQELENVPAYKRKEIALQQTPASNESQISRFTLLTDEDGKTEIRNNNPFLHDNVD